MLIQFRAENFLSIKGSVVLSLLASKDKEHPKHLIVNGSKRYLKSAGIYGANASGKSNVLHAFWFMVNYVLTSHNQQLHKAIERSPFKFDRETPVRPSSFEVIFTANGIRYAYGFSVTDKVVIEEYLYYYPNGRQAIIFERQNTNDFRFTVDVDEQSMLKNRTSPNKLYLSVASNWSYSKVIPVLEWFASCRIITKHSAADAYELEAEQLKRKAIIINADMNVPMLPVWLPEQIIQTNTSIGQVLSSVEIDTSLVASHVTVLKNYPFIGMMGYAAGENPLSYPEVKYTMVLQLIHAAAKLVDFVILDCSTSMTNVFTPAAIEAGDVVIRILTPDLKGINYLKAHQPLLVDERFRFSEHMTFAGLARPFHALDEMGYIIGGFDGLLPYSKEIDRCATEGGMFKAITYCNPKYTASLNKVLEILEQMELAEQSEDDAAYECEEDADE